jgi:hypothetical protein
MEMTYQVEMEMKRQELFDQIVGYRVEEDIIDPDTGEILVFAGQRIDDYQAERISWVGDEFVAEMLTEIEMQWKEQCSEYNQVSNV